MANILIIGAGKMARAIAFDLRRFNPVHELTVLDRDSETLAEFGHFINDPDIKLVSVDASNPIECARHFRDADLAIGAAGYAFNAQLTELAIDSRVHWVDLGGNNDVVSEQFKMHKAAEIAGVAILPDCGLAPGMVSIIAGDALGKLDQVGEMHFRVGGLPQKPKGPLEYGLVFSADGLANEYSEPCMVIRNGKLETVEPLTGWERVHVGPPFGTLEAFHTSGGSSTMVHTLLGRVDILDYKTLRYPGHLRKIRLLYELGLFDKQPLTGVDGREISPRETFVELMEREGWITDDLVILKSWISGKRSGKKVRLDYSLLDFADEDAGLTSMARTTGFSAAVVARMILDGDIAGRGVLNQELNVPSDIYFEHLAARSVKVEIEES